MLRKMMAMAGAAPYHVYILIGDSLARGNSDGEGPTPTANTVFEWDGSTLVQVTTNDLVLSETGSPWPQFGALRHTATRARQVFVNSGRGGSTISDKDQLGRIWSATGPGSLWQDAVDKAAGALALPGAILKGVIISGGVNDYRESVKPTAAEFKTFYQDLINRVVAAWAPPEILLMQVARSANESPLAGEMRAKVLELQTENATVFVAANILSYYAQNYLQVDGVHFTQTGNNKAGYQISRHLDNAALSKRMRNLLSRFDTALSAAHQAAWQTFIDACSTHGNLTAIESLQVFVATTDLNRKTELMGIGIPQPDSATHTPNSHVATDGVATFIGAGYVPSHDFINTNSDDILMGVKVKQTTTAAGTTACLFGGQASSQFYLLQNSSGLSYRVFDSTNRVWTAKTKPSDNTYYAIGRNGTTKFLMENATQVDSLVAATTTQIARPMAVGARGNNFGSYDLFLAGEWECFFVLKWSAVTSYADFIADMNTLLAALKA